MVAPSQTNGVRARSEPSAASYTASRALLSLLAAADDEDDEEEEEDGERGGAAGPLAASARHCARHRAIKAIGC